MTACDRSQLDLADRDALVRGVRSIRPQIIVNAAAYTAVDKAESEVARAEAINAVAPAILAEEAKRVDAVLIHFSTDYVFDGTSAIPYDEQAPTGPLNVYGRTKRDGERAIAAIGGAHLIFRTSWVYGLRGSNFLLTMLRLAAEREELRVVADQCGVPNWSRDLADTIAALVRRGRAGAGRARGAVSPERGWRHQLVRIRARDHRGGRTTARGPDHDRGVPDAGAAAGLRRTGYRQVRAGVRHRAAGVARRPGTLLAARNDAQRRARG